MKDNLDYGIIGNCRSAALISKTGSIDWCCLPEFDSSSVFAKILDDRIGGYFGFVVDESYQITQFYLNQTAILVTRFSNGLDIFEVHDFMPRYHKSDTKYQAPPEIIRYVKYVSGKPSFKVDYQPKLEYAKGVTDTFVKDDFIVSLTHSDKFDTLFMYSNLDNRQIVEGDAILLNADAFFLLGYNEKVFKPTVENMFLEHQRTKVYWLNWIDRTPKYNLYNAQILRSAITLKLLSYDKTGAVLAAATTSLPETIGEVRNWDYRFCWIRDASMVIKVLSHLGHRGAAQRYLQFIIDLIPDKDEKLQIMYGINKEKQLTELTLDHLSGYHNSKPVRIGNAAYMQKQNDIYGILMDVINQQFEKFTVDVEKTEELWTITKGIVWVVEKHWREPDKGIWEFRTEDRHFTFSKVLCWVAVDRAIKVAEKLDKYRKINKWKLLEAEIKNDILEKAWNDEVKAFTQSYGSKYLDASVLLMENYGFIEARDPKYVSTVLAIEKELSYDGLMYRYKNEDDFGLPSSSFTICTFWFINSLYKIGEKQKAKKMFDQLLTYSNHLGLIETAINLSEITEEEKVKHTMA